MTISVKTKLLDPYARAPQYAREGDAGADLFSVEDTVIAVRQSAIIRTGIALEIPVGYECQIRPRSGHAAKFGVTVLNAPGTIDAGYRGELKVILINHGAFPFIIKKGDKIAQIVIAPVVNASFNIVRELSESERGVNGFGSTSDIERGVGSGWGFGL
jgi:dUTP pyrophosphatase